MADSTKYCWKTFPAYIEIVSLESVPPVQCQSVKVCVVAQFFCGFTTVLRDLDYTIFIGELKCIISPLETAWQTEMIYIKTLWYRCHDIKCLSRLKPVEPVV